MRHILSIGGRVLPSAGILAADDFFRGLEGIGQRMSYPIVETRGR